MPAGQVVLQGFREGQAKALEALYRAHVDDVVRTARAIMCKHAATPSGAELGDDIADVVQECFIKAFSPEARRRFDSERAFVPYLRRIARNVAIDHWRARRRNVLVDIERVIDQLSMEAESFGGEDWRDGELLAVASRYIGSLAGDLRRVHDALYVKGLSQRAAADELGLGRQVIRTMEARLRAGLQRELVRAGVPPPLR